MYAELEAATIASHCWKHLAMSTVITGCLVVCTFVRCKFMTQGHRQVRSTELHRWWLCWPHVKCNISTAVWPILEIPVCNQTSKKLRRCSLPLSPRDIDNLSQTLFWNCRVSGALRWTLLWSSAPRSPYRLTLCFCHAPHFYDKVYAYDDIWTQCVFRPNTQFTSFGLSWSGSHVIVISDCEQAKWHSTKQWLITAASYHHHHHLHHRHRYAHHHCFCLVEHFWT